MSRFEGRVALITGASRGIGLAIAERLVGEGARVCITARKADTLSDALETLGDRGQSIAVPGNASDPEHQADAIKSTLDAFGRLDVLVNNTGINPVFGPLLELDHAAARKIFDVNVLAALGWVQQAHNAYLGQHGGSIVNVASIAGLRPAAGLGAYGASKAALIHLTQQLAVELGPTVRVNAVAPAVVKTRFASTLFENREQEVASSYPLQRLGVPMDVAGAVAYLASDDASWVTGNIMVLDGGLTLEGGI